MGVSRILASVMFLTVSATLAQAESPFVEALSSNWAKFDTNKDNEISKDEINAALKNPSIKGDAAAALAALKIATRGKGEVPAFTKTYFDEYSTKAGPVKKESKDNLLDSTTDPATQVDNSRSQAAAPATQPAKGINWERNFAASKVRIEKNTANPKFFDPAAMSLETTRQGQLGDCYLISSMSSLMNHDKDRFLKLVQTKPDGSYTVTFPGKQPVTFAAPTQAQLALGGTASGAWLPIMEQAWGKYRSQEKGNGTDVEGTDGIAGGDSGATLIVITGHKFKRVTFPISVEDRQAEQSQKLAEARQMLQLNLKEHRAITAGTLPRKPKTGTPYKNPPGITLNHVYVITGYDAKTDKVTLWNPHGNAFKPKGPDGLANGYTTEKGFFTLPLEEAYSFYTSFTFETNEPAAPEKASIDEK